MIATIGRFFICRQLQFFFERQAEPAPNSRRAEPGANSRIGLVGALDSTSRDRVFLQATCARTSSLDLLEVRSRIGRRLSLPSTAEGKRSARER